MQQKSTRQVHESDGLFLCKMYICLWQIDKTRTGGSRPRGGGGRRSASFYARTYQNATLPPKPAQDLHILLQK